MALEVLSAVEKSFTLGGQEVSVARSIPMKDHRHQTAGARKDMARHANQQQLLEENEKVTLLCDSAPQETNNAPDVRIFFNTCSG